MQTVDPYAPLTITDPPVDPTFDWYTTGIDILIKDKGLLPKVDLDTGSDSTELIQETMK